MTLLHESLENKKFDTRIVEKNITRKVVDQKEYSKFVKELKDVESNAERVSMDEFTGKESPRGSDSHF